MSPSDLAERTVHRRAVEAVIWGMPAVNCDLMFQATVREAWVPTSADSRFEVLFRFYGPEKPLFDKTWRLPDIEKV